MEKAKVQEAEGEGEGEGEDVFKEEHLRGIYRLKRGKGFIEMMCGCTSAKYGDAVGTLRISEEGVFEIACECSPGGCEEGTLTPPAFEKHAGNRSKKWKNNIWVIRENRKVPLCKTGLLAYHNPGPAARKGRAARRAAHRDEFVRCSLCGKERRFKRRDRDECRVYHDAARNPNWSCKDFPYEVTDCQLEEERAASRKAHRGCPKATACEGCYCCVCLGCDVCLFPDCNCRTCVDFFTSNAKA